jgi:hypothetical protein
MTFSASPIITKPELSAQTSSAGACVAADKGNVAKRKLATKKNDMNIFKLIDKFSYGLFVYKTRRET